MMAKKMKPDTAQAIVDPPNSVRFQLNLSSERINEINRLMLLGGVDTKKEFVNSSISLLKWAIDAVMAGKKIYAVDPKTGMASEPIMPILDAASARRFHEEGTRLVSAASVDGVPQMVSVPNDANSELSQEEEV